jgi:hypothetical protein
VAPPAFAVEAARKAGLLSDIGFDFTPAIAKASCCSSDKLTTCSESSPAGIGQLAEAKLIRVSVAAVEQAEDQVDSVVVTDSRSQTVLAWRALSCQGQSLNWLTVAPVVFAVPFDLAMDRPVYCWLGPPMSDSARSLYFDLVAPPPELG